MNRIQELSKRAAPRQLVSWLAVVGLMLIAPMLVWGDGFVGSLPSADGGDGSQNFYLTGPRDQVEASILDAWGDGYFVVVALAEDRVWLEFYGDVTVVFDRDVISDPSFEIGLSAGFNGGGMLVFPEIDGVVSSRSVAVDMGFTWATPLNRIGKLLEGELSFLTTQVGTGQRAEIQYLSYGDDVLVLRQDIK